MIWLYELLTIIIVAIFLDHLFLDGQFTDAITERIRGRKNDEE